MKRKNSNCEEEEKIFFLQNPKTQTVTKLKNSNCYSSNSDSSDSSSSDNSNSDIF